LKKRLKKSSARSPPLPWPPSRIHHSGHGLHLYWFLQIAIEASTENRVRHKQLLRRIAELIGGDPAACLIPQLMRLPGTINSKNGEHREVSVLSDRADLRYDYAELERLVAATPTVLLHRKSTKPEPAASNSGNGASADNPFLTDNPFLDFARTYGDVPLDVEQMLADMVYLGSGQGGNAHDTLLRCSAALLSSSVERDIVIERCLTALEAAAERSGIDIDPEQERKIIAGMCDSWIAKHPKIEKDEPAGTEEKSSTDAPPISAKAVINKWPVLGESAYYGLAGKVVNALLPETEAGPAALLLQYLACFGNMVGRTAFIRIANANHYPNIFVMIAGRTARSRKGTSAQDVRAITERVDPDWTRNNIKSGVSSGEGIIELVRDARYALNRKTQEMECVDPGIDDKRLLLDEREFSSALNKMKQDTNIVSRVLREAWDCIPPVLASRAKNNPSVATEPLISVTAHITLHELQLKLEKLSLSDGFGNRFLYVCTDRSKLLPHGGNFDAAVLDALAAKTRKAVETARTRTAISIAEEAKPIWAAAYTAVESVPPTDGLIDHITARAAPQMLRLALLFALTDEAAQIGIPHIEAARTVWEFCEASAAYIFAETTSDHTADEIMRALDSVRPNSLSRWDIMNIVFGRHITAHELTRALIKLETDGKISRKKQLVRGRQTELWFAS
jgi:hypothetical protein